MLEETVEAMEPGISLGIQDDYLLTYTNIHNKLTIWIGISLI